MTEEDIRDICTALVNKGYVSLPATILGMLDRILELSDNEMIVLEGDVELIEAEIRASQQEVS